ncbi:uncharacterized protein KZ484_001170 isoform 3-T3 [Pholidichthys leucotaenia]
MTIIKMLYCCTALLMLTFIPRPSQGGNILVLPIEGSHWINMEIILKALHSKGHNITILRSSTSWYIKDDSYYNTITVPVENTLDQKFITRIVSEFHLGACGAHPPPTNRDLHHMETEDSVDHMSRTDENQFMTPTITEDSREDPWLFTSSCSGCFTPTRSDQDSHCHHHHHALFSVLIVIIKFNRTAKYIFLFNC